MGHSVFMEPKHEGESDPIPLARSLSEPDRMNEAAFEDRLKRE